MTTRRIFSLQLAALAGVSSTIFGNAHAQSLDTAKILVGFPPGGGTDAIARRLAEKMRGSYANNVLVDNKPGAATQIAITSLKDSAPDGSTMLLNPTGPFSIYPFTYRKLPYSNDDIVPVTTVCTFPFGFAVGPAVPESVRNVRDFITWCKANPSKANFGSPASGSTPHLLGILLSKLAGVELTHVGYRGDAPGLQDLMGGQVSGYMSTSGAFLPLLKSGKLRVLAISGTGRNSFVPDVPTFQEQGYAINASEQFGIFMSSKTSSAIISRAASMIQPLLSQPEVVSTLALYGMTPNASSSQELTDVIKKDTDDWRQIIKQIGFTAES